MATKIILFAIIAITLIGVLFVASDLYDFKKEIKMQREKNAAIKNARWSVIFITTNLKASDTGNTQQKNKEEI